MKILVTGGEGFIGSWIVEKLCRLKHEVYTIDNHDTYGLINNEDLRKLHKWRQRNWADKVYKFRGSVTEKNQVLSVFQHRPEIIIHLASYPRAKIVHQNPMLGIENIVNGTINLLEHSKNFGVKRFVFVSSSMIYGNFSSGVKESDNTKPINIYGEAKLATERFCKHYQKFNGLEYCIARPSGVYGPGDIPDRVVTTFYDRAIKNETLKIHKGIGAVDFTYVEDAADGIIKCALHPGAANLSFNVASGEATSLRSLAENIVSITDSESDIVEEGRSQLYPARGALDISRAKDILNYTPGTSLLKGLNRYHEWYQAHKI